MISSRVKDLDDIRGLLAKYEANSDRVFSDVVFDAELEDYELAPAFLMGIDLRALCDRGGSACRPSLPRFDEGRQSAVDSLRSGERFW